MDMLILLVAMCVFFAIGMPISYALALASLVGAWWIDIPLEAVMLKISDGVSKFAMLTIPFFVLAGAIMAEGGMARRLVAFAEVLVGVIGVRGGLSVVNIVATSFLSGISGSSVADTSAIGSVMIPQMEKVGYPRVFATNVTITASVQALLVPPSHNAVIYSLATGGSISIISFFIARGGPGLLLRFSIMILFLINVLLLVLGCLVDMAPSILICTPILLPVMVNFGVDPVHFGMIMMLNLGIGLCHPPVGSILFVGCAVGKVTIEQVMRRIWPFYGVMFAVLMLVTYVPEISLWFPRWVLQK